MRHLPTLLVQTFPQQTSVALPAKVFHLEPPAKVLPKAKVTRKLGLVTPTPATCLTNAFSLDPHAHDRAERPPANVVQSPMISRMWT